LDSATIGFPEFAAEAASFYGFCWPLCPDNFACFHHYLERLLSDFHTSILK
jgi:hypothetical protein